MSPLWVNVLTILGLIVAGWIYCHQSEPEIDIQARLQLDVIQEAFKDLAEVHGYIYFAEQAVVALLHKVPLSVDKDYGESNLLNTHAGGIITSTDPIYFSTRYYYDNGKNKYVHFLASASSILCVKWDRSDLGKYTRSQAVHVLRSAFEELFEKGVCTSLKSLCSKGFSVACDDDYEPENWVEHKKFGYDHMHSLGKWWYTDFEHTDFMLT